MNEERDKGSEKGKMWITTRLQGSIENNHLKVTPEILRIKSEMRGDDGERLRANWTAHMSSK